MKRPSVILRRLEWRLGLRAGPLRVPSGMTRLEFEAALESLPFDVDAEELREFVEAEAPAAPAQTACPVFRERLRRLLWGLVRREPSMPERLEQPLH